MDHDGSSLVEELCDLGLAMCAPVLVMERDGHLGQHRNLGGGIGAVHGLVWPQMLDDLGVDVALVVLELREDRVAVDPVHLPKEREQPLPGVVHAKAAPNPRVCGTTDTHLPRAYHHKSGGHRLADDYQGRRCLVNLVMPQSSS